MNLSEKLYKNRFKVDKNNPHIAVDNSACRICDCKVCLVVCPAEVYSLDDGEIIASFQGCLECGTCQIACSKKAIKWGFPRGGFGIYFRYG